MLTSVKVIADHSGAKGDAVIIPVFPGPRSKPVATATLGRGLSAALNAASERKIISGKRAETYMTSSGGSSPTYVMLLGLGDIDKLDAEGVADAAGTAAALLNKNKCRSATLLLDGVSPDLGEFARAFVKGFSLAGYSYKLGSRDTSALKRLTFVSRNDRRLVSDGANAGLVVASHIAATRDMVNTPPNILTPTALAGQAQKLCASHGVSCEIKGLAGLKKEKLGALLAVAQGSREEPRLIMMHYNKGRKDLPLTCLVGKGVTFDSGGLSLKPANGMIDMKGDMAGAAVVIGAMNAAAELGLEVRLLGLVPAVENMPDGLAFRPGDVITSYSGETIEILNTDAEGRLVLSDAIAYARKNFKPDLIVDYATLTGAVLIALGTRIAGVMGNSQKHIDEIRRAGARSGEPTWQLPLDDHFYEQVKGEISDYKNYSGRNGSTITAAALLGKFAGSTPWVHVDIAGTFWGDDNASYNPKGATGYGVDLTVRFLEQLAQE